MADTTIDDTTTGALESGTSDATVGEPTGDTNGTSTDDTTEGGTDTDETGSGTGSETGMDTETGMNTETGGDVCDFDPRDVPCMACIKKDCCPEVEACLADAVCNCAYDCLMGGDPQQCWAECNANNEVSVLLAQCLQWFCVGEC